MLAKAATARICGKCGLQPSDFNDSSLIFVINMVAKPAAPATIPIRDAVRTRQVTSKTNAPDRTKILLVPDLLNFTDLGIPSREQNSMIETTMK